MPLFITLLFLDINEVNSELLLQMLMLDLKPLLTKLFQNNNCYFRLQIKQALQLLKILNNEILMYLQILWSIIYPKYGFFVINKGLQANDDRSFNKVNTNI